MSSLDKKEIIEMLDKAGLKEDENLTADKIKSAIAEVITEREEEIEKENETLNKIKWMYNR
ncbi:hypothetical protein [Alkalithermobacter paradoxus]|uniref:Uncharacterized protein n=1 Tax=Alkalithermobacter paradoxus TaxID=29349 RepID=A0A1V4I3M6_9FIRM|nr:hypothetical protein CLOTH_20900 [[Clostridium] thermoalcaliphilum]OPJ57305.1 hypothetical protein CLOTH_05880 [[Clostridium] thermoalcaliphilum]